MRTALMRLLKALALLVPIVTMVLFSQEYLFYHEDDNSLRISGFYSEPTDTLDMVMLGASDMYDGFSPGYAYDYSGLTSYLYACAGNSGASYLSQVKEIFAHQDPQLLVIEVHGFLTGIKREFYEEPVLRRYVENIPMSANKVEAILHYEYDDPLSCFFPFFKYHGQWVDDEKALCKRFHHRIQNEEPAPTRLKGYGTNSLVCSTAPVYDATANDETVPLLPEAKECLLELLAYLQNQELKERVVFIRFPHRLLTDRNFLKYMRANTVEKIVTEHGFDYLDLEQNILNTGIDYKYDFRDDDHLNFYGQQKMTEYLCDYLMESYGLEPMIQTDENQQRWEESAAYVYALQAYSDEIADKARLDYLYETPELLCELEKRIEQ